MTFTVNATPLSPPPPAYFPVLRSPSMQFGSIRERTKAKALTEAPPASTAIRMTMARVQARTVFVRRMDLEKGSGNGRSLVGTSSSTASVADASDINSDNESIGSCADHSDAGSDAGVDSDTDLSSADEFDDIITRPPKIRFE